MSKKEMIIQLDYLKAMRNFHQSIAKNMGDISLINLFNHQASKYDSEIESLEKQIKSIKKPRKKKSK